MEKKCLTFLYACLIAICLFTNSLWSADLIVGTTSAYAPFVSLDEQGKYVGFDIDIAEELAKKLSDPRDQRLG